MGLPKLNAILEPNKSCAISWSEQRVLECEKGNVTDSMHTLHVRAFIKRGEATMKADRVNGKEGNKLCARAWQMAMPNFPFSSPQSVKSKGPAHQTFMLSWSLKGIAC